MISEEPKSETLGSEDNDESDEEYVANKKVAEEEEPTKAKTTSKAKGKEVQSEESKEYDLKLAYSPNFYEKDNAKLIAMCDVS